MIIDCISDMHGEFPTLSGGDLLIMSGDCTIADKVKQWMEFFEWFKAQNYRQKVLVAGNHDGFLERCISSQEAREMLIDEQEGFEYLCDTGIEFEGVKIWGSPWTPRFGNWNFMLPRGERIRQKWANIPLDTDILVTHGPPFGLLDKTYDGRRAGCEELRARILDLKDLKLHVFGHIHEDYGWKYRDYDIGETEITPVGHLSVNCSVLNREYDLANAPVRVILENGQARIWMPLPALPG